MLVAGAKARERRTAAPTGTGPDPVSRSLHPRTRAAVLRSPSPCASYISCHRRRPRGDFDPRVSSSIAAAAILIMRKRAPLNPDLFAEVSARSGRLAARHEHRHARAVAADDPPMGNPAALPLMSIARFDDRSARMRSPAGLSGEVVHAIPGRSVMSGSLSQERLQIALEIRGRRVGACRTDPSLLVGDDLDEMYSLGS